MSLLEDLNWRHAVKAFDPNKKVSTENIDKIVEAMRLAPTSSGLQPFRVLVIENQAIKKKMVPGSLNPDSMAQCSHVLVLAAWDNYTNERIDNVYDYTTDVRDLPKGRFSSYTDKIKSIYNNLSAAQNFEHAARQAYIALGLGMAQAAELKIDTCPAEGFSNAVVDEVLELDKVNLKSVLLLYVGYSNTEKDWLANMKKVRIPMEEFATIIK